MGKARGLHYGVRCGILDQLKFPGGLQGQPQVQHIAVIQIGGDWGMSDHEPGL